MKEAAPPPRHTHKDTRAAELMQTEDRHFLRDRRRRWRPISNLMEPKPLLS